MLSEIMEQAIRAGDNGHESTVVGVGLAVTGGIGWLTTENLLWLIPIVGSIYFAVMNAYYGTRLIKAQSRYRLEAFRKKLEQESNVKLEPIEFSPDPDLDGKP